MTATGVLVGVTVQSGFVGGLQTEIVLLKYKLKKMKKKKLEHFKRLR